MPRWFDLELIGIVLGATALVTFGGVAIRTALVGIRTGTNDRKGWPVASRARRPLLFWFYTGVQLCIGAGCFLALGYAVLLALTTN